MTMPDLFGGPEPGSREQLDTSAWVLRGFAMACIPELLTELGGIEARSPFRHMVTASGLRLAVAVTSCGELGWTSDRHGYCYRADDPLSGKPWPTMPPRFAELAEAAARDAGFAGFKPDACLINRYRPGDRLSLHQDRNERDFSAPIVTVSLGMSAVFLWGGKARSDRAVRVQVHHGDVMVWGGVDRLRFHGVMPVVGSAHEVLGRQRISLTFRKAG